ncbi:lipoprotein-releasing system ATP-binding protein LolD [Candidatus Poribacteria bacterium]|nr:lipoprotein-releasing system ATP-binding protein LolD [Candidatus Poribacteria bacterium]
MSDRAAFIDVENLVKTFVDGDDRIAVLQGLTLSIARGEVLAIVGESGAGKSTLLHLLGGLDTPTSGSVRFEGRDITSLGTAELDLFRSEEVGFVFQFHHLMVEFTALENVAIGGMVAGAPRAAAEARARELLVNVGLEARLTHRPPKLSGGERQRVALARALVNDPRVVLADEPTGNLDRKTSEAVHDLIWDLRERLGQTFVIVTHNAGLAQRSDRTVELVDGRIAAAVSGAV